MALATSKAELLRQGYEAFQTGDMDRLRELFHPDIVWHSAGNNPTAGDFRGTDEVLASFMKLFEGTDGTFKVELHDVLESDEHVVALGIASGTRKGHSISEPYAHVCHYKDGKLAEAWVVNVDQAKADEFWKR